MLVAEPTEMTPLTAVVTGIVTFADSVCIPTRALSRFVSLLQDCTNMAKLAEKATAVMVINLFFL